MGTRIPGVIPLHTHRALRGRLAAALLKILSVKMVDGKVQATLSVANVPSWPIFESWLRTLTLRICDPSTGYVGSARMSDTLRQGGGTAVVETESIAPASSRPLARTSIVLLETEDGERMHERNYLRACAP